MYNCTEQQQTGRSTGSCGLWSVDLSNMSGEQDCEEQGDGGKEQQGDQEEKARLITQVKRLVNMYNAHLLVSNVGPGAAEYT